MVAKTTLAYLIPLILSLSPQSSVYLSQWSHCAFVGPLVLILIHREKMAQMAERRLPTQQTRVSILAVSGTNEIAPKKVIFAYYSRDE